ncbi:hypothetical protein [Kingella sp. (in: b-proteobacteria)]|uniref:hypothetical protein n=1 Tax=Kingella sp. (in: b-proteobacteria) TaxID=2020713 RepID=UPI0026DB968A|nr:hypothetical protein [Kingella sp. (in: b-proteobacteria)]MDO4658106.1 hypothetical protein [Kingella sp. (in: b-proteobacteria)]
MPNINGWAWHTATIPLLSDCLQIHRLPLIPKSSAKKTGQGTDENNRFRQPENCKVSGCQSNLGILPNGLK